MSARVRSTACETDWINATRDLAISARDLDGHRTWPPASDPDPADSGVALV
jgi:hypothetical protein